MPKNPLTGVTNEAHQARANKRVADLIRDGIARLETRIGELTAFDPSKITQKHPPKLKELSSAIQTTLATIFGDDTPRYRVYSEAATLRWAPSRARERTSTLEDYVRGYDANRRGSLALLGQAIQTLKEDMAELDLEPKAVGTAPESRQPNQNDEPATSPAPKPAELLTLKPGIWGMSFDLKEAWRRAMRWWRGSN